MARIFLGLAFHNHQPVGNFDWVFDESYRQAYLPMLDALERHPSIRLSLHYTGPLLDWLRQRYPAFLLRIAALVKRGQVEMMTGGYYEPILPSIPDDDKLGQIARMTQVVENELGYTPTGMWLAERVWEPHLPKFTAQSGVEWTVVDDTHFKMVGLADDDLFGYYVTEEQGHMLKVFATSKYLRYTIPWVKVDEVIAYLRSQATDDGTKIAVMGDDGEKFGVWPGTHQLCWERGWMDDFFTAIERNQDWLQIIPLGEYVRRFPARGRVYLPTASYAEMLEWALPPAVSHQFSTLAHKLEKRDDLGVARFVRGGFWRYFLVKYDEINSMHKKMLRVHDKVYGKPLPSDQRAAPAYAGADPEALTNLWSGQTNCPYWHGVFGGVYMTDVRTAVYRHLIAAQVRAETMQRGPDHWLDWEKTDFDCDSNDELLVEGDAVNLYFDLARGGSLFEWDVRSHLHNITSCMTRRPEAYHQTLLDAVAAQAAAHAQQTLSVSVSAGGKEERSSTQKTARESDESVTRSQSEGVKDESVKTIHDIVRTKEKGLEKLLHYDWYRRACLVDHFLHPRTTLEEFATCRYGEDGDFVNMPYEVTVEETPAGEAPGGLTVRLWRDGHVWVRGEFLPFRVEKTVRILSGSDSVEIGYQLTNTSRRAIDFTYGVEFNLNFLGGGHNPDAYFLVPGRKVADSRFDSSGEVTEVGQFEVGNRYLGFGLSIECSLPATLWRFSVESVSSSEGGFERVHQGSCFLLRWPLRLGSGESREITLTGGCQSARPVL